MRVIVLVLSLIISTCVFAVDTSDLLIKSFGTYRTGNDYNLLPDDTYKSIYLQGVLDGLLTSVHIQKDKWRKSLHQCVTGKPMDQIRAIFEKFMRENPEKWDWPAGGLVLLALLKDC